MHHHERRAFFKFFITYFFSVAILILLAGHLYFTQIQNHLMRMEEFKLIEYARHLKMKMPLDEFSEDYSYQIVANKKHIDIKNFKVTKSSFIKYVPIRLNLGYIKVTKSKKDFNQASMILKQKVIWTQIALLLLFAFISYKLAKNALKPLQDSISTLDKFAKDLIHDLNTPVTSIKLNLKLLEKENSLKNKNALKRLNKSVKNISELHENLTILLEEETFQLQKLNLCNVIDDVVSLQRQIYPKINFFIECKNLTLTLHEPAIKQILQNIISNACKYNVENGYVKIYHKAKKLYIEDSGKGIKEPDKIFTRAYSDENSSGIGLDIVKRLAHSMDIDITVKTKEQGSVFILTMH